MSRYKDRQYPQSTVFLLLITAFLLIFSPWLSGLRELHWLEGNFALRALEMNFWIPVVQEYGQVIPYACPLYPFLAKILIHFGIPPEMALRVLSETALLLLALLVYYITKRNSNATAAAVATAVLISSCIVIEKAMDGYPDTLTVLLIFIGQMLWFNYGANRSDWNWAWIGFFAAVALAFYNGGLAAFLYAAFPLIFMRRPLSISHKLNKGGFYLALAIFGLLLFLWALPSPLPKTIGIFRNGLTIWNIWFCFPSMRYGVSCLGRSWHGLRSVLPFKNWIQPPSSVGSSEHYSLLFLRYCGYRLLPIPVIFFIWRHLWQSSADTTITF